MIVPMKKVSLILLEHERDAALASLRELGVMHIEAAHETSDRLADLRERRDDTSKALRTLQAVEPEGAEPHDHMRPVDIVAELEELDQREATLQEERERLARERDRLALWGRFDPGDIRSLAEHGVTIRLYLLTKDELKRIDTTLPWFVVCRNGPLTGVACIGKEGLPELEEFQLPERGMDELEAAITEIEERLAEVADRRRVLATHTQRLESELAHLADEIDLEQARLAMGLEGNLVHLTGFVPAEVMSDVEDEARSRGWALLARDPEPEDQVPTLVRNPKPVRIIKPIFKLLGTIPGYREHDISLLFLLFFALFFAMIIGDAGYGAVFLIGTVASIVASRRKGRPAGEGQVLLLVLSLATIVWGAITGTWFGSETIADSPPFNLLVIPALSSFNPRSSERIKYFCFIIGTVQIIIAHLWNFVSELKGRPRIRAFAQIGWISMLCGIYYLVLNVVLDPTKYPLPQFALYLIGAGLVFVILFSAQDGNFFKGVLKGIGGLLTTFLDGISAFADVISYIRLFAVGLATVEIAKSFNAMAADLGSSVVGIGGAVIILLLGHTLNLAMGALSVVVHGVRLNMLEFSGHLGMEWTGIAYDPLRKNTQSEYTEPKESNST